MEFRQALSSELLRLMRKDDKIFVLDADLGKPDGISPIEKEFPNRYIQCGIAEANMASVAAGLSAYGYKPVIVSFAPFVTRRVFDQIAVSIAYAKQNVKIVGTDPGLVAELNGGTHMTFEDVALMRSLPNMVVVDVVDAVQLQAAVETLVNHPGNVYIRTPRKNHPDVFAEDYKYEIGKADVIKQGKDLTLVASGILAYESLQAANNLEKEGYSVEVIAVNSLKPFDADTIVLSAKKTNKVVTVENHNVHGGLYSAVCETLCAKYPSHVRPMAINDEFGQVGKFNELLSAYHLNVEDIEKVIKEELK